MECEVILKKCFCLICVAALLFFAPRPGAVYDRGEVQTPEEGEIALLAGYIYKVCGRGDYITMLYVGSVVCNRVVSPAFADSVAEVLSGMAVPETPPARRFSDIAYNRGVFLIHYLVYTG